MTRMKPFQFFEAGANAEAVRSTDRHESALKLESRYGELRSYTASLYEEYEKLCSACEDLQGRLTSAETERDAMEGRVSELTDKLSAMEARAELAAQTIQSLRDNAASWMEASTSKLESYEVLKKVLRGLFDDADTVFTDAITVEQRKELARLLHHLP